MFLNNGLVIYSQNIWNIQETKTFQHEAHLTRMEQNQDVCKKHFNTINSTVQCYIAPDSNRNIKLMFLHKIYYTNYVHNSLFQTWKNDIKI